MLGGAILGSGTAKANLDHGRATSARTHTPQDKYHTVHRYIDIVTWWEIEGGGKGGSKVGVGVGAALRRGRDRLREE